MSAANSKNSGRRGTPPSETMSLIIANRQRTKKINLHLLKQITNTLLADLRIEIVELGINLVGAKKMAVVNRAFLQHEGSTDVITFDYLNPESRIQNPELQLHGELFICVDDAISQARQFKTTWTAETVRYIIHGVLHLLGHDDLKPNLRRKMKRAENRLLRRLSQKFSLAQIGGGSKLRA
jgi:probable rRNA maturation factor